ncbi:MAG TPA: DHA2 family efflux MFS transporter permease subunit, partial [Steroidobacteraceae bacterium]|nr:DHA2 family efflux MFS transporter permease subunit [Steroidobacteraceae bacterium]
PALVGGMLWVAAMVLALANFVAVLNMTIANVTVPNIAGALGAGSSQGTWVITSYAVAEAITVPLTGWLSARFGAVRLFCVAVVLFGVCSLLCGLSTSLYMLLGMRVLQGMAGGPLMALSQTLLLRIFPKSQSMQAMGLWAMTTLLAPVVGPVLGGWLCDNYTWSWVFFINVPMALAFGVIAWGLLKRYHDPAIIKPVDRVGMLLLIVWVGALQIMLDEGKDKDWFSSMEIRVLAVVTVIGFLAFLIWELTEQNPIVELRVFRHRGFSSCMLVLALAFGAFFGLNVLTPQWLQYNMGYTTTWAGLVVAWGGLLSVVFSPIAAKLAGRIDPRVLIFIGCLWLGVDTFWRAYATPDMSYLLICIPMFFMGVGMPMYYVPLTGLAMGSVNEAETASAAGLMNFVRTISGAIATSLVTTSWQNRSIIAHDELTSVLDPTGEVGAHLPHGLSGQMVREMVNNLVTSQSLMLATNGLMMVIAAIFIVASVAIVLAPRAARTVDAASVGH